MESKIEMGGAIPEILEAWETKQKDMKKEGMDAKEISKIYQDKQWNPDLATLTEQGGPFTRPEQVQDFLNSPNEEDINKNNRLYTEIRHAKNSSLSFPKCSDFFRLKKKCKNLSSAEYASNLITYLGKITCNVNMNFRDFREVLNSISKE